MDDAFWGFLGVFFVWFFSYSLFFMKENYFQQSQGEDE